MRVHMYLCQRAVLSVFGGVANSGTQFGSRDTVVVADEVFRSSRWQGGVAHLSSHMTNSLNYSSPLLAYTAQSAGFSSFVPTVPPNNAL